jgi:hypothetical protein
MALLVTFPNVHAALAAERAARRLFPLAAAGASFPFAAAGERGSSGSATPTLVDLVPLPPAVRSDCGFGLLVEGEEAGEGAWLGALRDAGLSLSEAYRRAEGHGNGGRSYERIG